MSFFVQPNTVIRLCTGVPLTPAYENTLYFNSEQAQYNYFLSKVTQTFTQESYQRRSKNRIRLKINAEYIDSVNYLIFDNNRYYNNDPTSTKISKQYYAFVLDVVYINENVSEIIYEIDVMQTWHFNYSLNPCYVVREHSADDTIGAHTEPEALDLGPYQYESTGQVLAGQTQGTLNNPYIVLACTVDINFDDYFGGMVGGVYSGLYYVAFPATTYGATGCTTFIQNAQASGKVDAIVYAFMAPRFIARTAHKVYNSSGTFDNGASGSVAEQIFTRAPNTSWTFASDIPNSPTYPRNNKLYCYPYNFFGVSNNNGEMATYAWERWGVDANGYVNEEVVGALSATSELEYVPRNYSGVTGRNYNERILSTNWPQCSFNSDPYKAWLAGQGNISVVSDIQTGLNMVLQLGGQQYTNSGSGNDIANTANMQTTQSTTTQSANVSTDISGGGLNYGALINAFNTIYDLCEIANKYAVYDIVPPQNHGGGSGVIDVTTEIKGFTAYNIRIRNEYVMKIDDYFSRFGYACDRVKVPNRNVRTKWTYTRTRGCSITRGSVPQNDAVMIESIYNKGITFWSDHTNVGNYNLSNDIPQ